MAIYKLNKSQPVKVGKKFLSWQILDDEENLICDFRGPQSMMCCMAALKAMNDEKYSMKIAQDIYEETFS